MAQRASDYAGMSQRWLVVESEQRQHSGSTDAATGAGQSKSRDSLSAGQENSHANFALGLSVFSGGTSPLGKGPTGHF